MDVGAMMQELESLGSEQTRKTYRRHGVGENVFGVSFANFEKLRKRIKVNHELALQLWATGNFDAQVLATMIADAKAITNEQLDSWAGDLNNYSQADMLSKLVSRTKFAVDKITTWGASDEEWLGYTGWLTLANLANNDKELGDDYFEQYLPTIEREIHSRKNYVRYAMNTALIAIGARNANLAQQALAGAARIGKVVVDHGDTDCKTPDAAQYIAKARAHQEKKRASK